jgi:hypothetical protein
MGLFKYYGKVINSNYKKPDDAQYNVQVYISDEKGNITKNRISAVTDPSGSYTLDIPVIKTPVGILVPQIDGKFISAKQKSGDTGAKVLTLPLSADTVQYNFDLKTLGTARQIEDITVTGKKKPKEDAKKIPTWVWIGGGVLLLIGSYYLYKKFNK